MIRSGWTRTIRARLTLWHAMVLAAILLVYAGGVYLFLRQNLYAELDLRLHDDFELAEADFRRAADGGIVRTSGVELHIHDEDVVMERRLEVWSMDGKLLYSEGMAGLELPAPPPDEMTANAVAVRSVADGPDAFFRIYGAAYAIAGIPAWIRVARSEARLRHELGEFMAGIGFGLPAAVLFACIGGYFLAGRALKPFGQMAVQARTITAERLQERLLIENPDDEFGQLGTVFNETLARLERSFDALRRFTADAAHELRTPLTALRSVGEVGLRESRNEADYREVIGSVLEEADRLTRLVETLLTLARADSGRIEVTPHHQNLMQFAQSVLDVIGVLADEKGQRVVIEGDAEIAVHADALVLRHAVLNVLDNAIKHGPEGSQVRLVVGRDAVHAILDVIDQGPGIGVEHLKRIFDRFYRVDRARSRMTGGTGLGLSIAQWAVQANGGTIEVESRIGEGSRFRFRLPLTGKANEKL